MTTEELKTFSQRVSKYLNNCELCLSKFLLIDFTSINMIGLPLINMA